MIFHLFLDLCFGKLDLFLVAVFLSIDIRSTQRKRKGWLSYIHVQISRIQCLGDRYTSFWFCPVMEVCDQSQILIGRVRIIRRFISDLTFSCDQIFLNFFPCIVDFLSIDFHWKELALCLPVVFRA